MMKYPKLRWPLDTQFQKINDQEVLILRCPLAIGTPLFLKAALAPILASFDGKTSLEEIVNKFSQYGITPSFISEILQILDNALLLDNEKFHEADLRRRKEFHASPIRKAALAGAVYPESKKALQETLDKYLSYGASEKTDQNLIALLAPHIDYARGGKCYGITYNRLRPQEHDLYIILGICHAYSSHAFHLCNKGFETPLGTQACDHEFVERLAKRYGEELAFSDEILHSTEHSIELQIPFISRLHPKTPLVPILTGSFHYALTQGFTDQVLTHYDAFVAALALCLQEEISKGKKICIIAAVDMSHIGQNFGDATALTPNFLQDIAHYDAQYLDAICNQDKSALLEHIKKYDEMCRICGFPAVYTTLDLLDRLNIKTSGEVLSYDQAVDYKTDCAVTFAGMALYA